MRLGWVIAIALACGCSKNNPNYCANAPQQNCSEATVDAAPDGPLGCTSQAACAGTSTPVCDTTQHICVACSSDYPMACPASAPVCVTAAETCRQCIAHSECGTNGACLPDGTCGTDTTTAWVAQSGTDTGTCTHDAPCATISFAASATTKSYIKVSGTVHDQPQLQRSVTILADPGAQLLPTTIGPIVTVKGTSSVAVTIYDLTITMGASATGDGVYVSSLDSPKVTLDHVTLSESNGRGVNMLGGQLVMSRCDVFHNNLAGIDASVPFDVTNTFILRNGNSTTGVGGAHFTLTSCTGCRFAFNTVVDNSIPNASSLSGGVLCDISGMQAPNNILARNFVNNSATASNSNHFGNCTYPTSVDESTVTDLHFVSSEGSPYDYHLGSGSVAIDHATTTMAIDVDVDGDTRPRGNAKDQGADEF